MTTRIYLDIDGVINAPYARKVWPEDRIRKGSALGEGHAYKIVWSPAMVKELNETDTEIVIASTWREDAILSIMPLVGLRRPVRVLHPNGDRLAETTYPTMEWKIPAVRQDIIDNPPLDGFIHIDDELDNHPTWMEEIRKIGGLVIAPAHSTGITSRLLDIMREYISDSK